MMGSRYAVNTSFVDTWSFICSHFQYEKMLSFARPTSYSFFVSGWSGRGMVCTIQLILTTVLTST